MSRRTCDASLDLSYAMDLRRAIARFLPHSGLALMSEDSKLCWVPRWLVIGAILMSWDVSEKITDAFENARRVVGDMCRAGHRKQPGESYQGFMQTLVGHTVSLLAVVAASFRGHVEAVARRAGCWAVGGASAVGAASGAAARVGKWVLFGVDGSRDECPRTKSNQKKFGSAGRDKSGPQQFVTTVFHVGSGLVWDFRTGDARSSERGHLLEMLGTLPYGPCTMLLADAGFVGYDFLGQIDASGRRFVIRIGANVKLLTKLGYAYHEYEGVVYLWPTDAQKEGRKPLVLRRITVVDGRNRRMHLLSNVMDVAEMSDAEAAELYKRRWGVELIYRALKQTLAKRKMRCASAANAAAELIWAIVALWVLGLMSVSDIVDAGGTPNQWGVAASLRAVRRAMSPAPRRRKSRPTLAKALASARKDAYPRTGSKTAADYPRKKRESPPGEPRARTASEAEIQRAAELKEKRRAA